MGGGDLAGASGEANPRRRGCGILIHPPSTAKRFDGGAPLFRRGRENSARGKKTTKGAGSGPATVVSRLGWLPAGPVGPVGGPFPFFVSFVLFYFSYFLLFWLIVWAPNEFCKI